MAEIVFKIQTKRERMKCKAVTEEGTKLVAERVKEMENIKTRL